MEYNPGKGFQVFCQFQSVFFLSKAVVSMLKKKTPSIDLGSVYRFLPSSILAHTSQVIASFLTFHTAARIAVCFTKIYHMCTCKDKNRLLLLGISLIN